MNRAMISLDMIILLYNRIETVLKLISNLSRQITEEEYKDEDERKILIIRLRGEIEAVTELAGELEEEIQVFKEIYLDLKKITTKQGFACVA